MRDSPVQNGFGRAPRRSEDRVIRLAQMASLRGADPATDHSAQRGGIEPSNSHRISPHTAGSTGRNVSAENPGLSHHQASRRRRAGDGLRRDSGSDRPARRREGDAGRPVREQTQPGPLRSGSEPAGVVPSSKCGRHHRPRTNRRRVVVFRHAVHRRMRTGSIHRRESQPLRGRHTKGVEAFREDRVGDGGSASAQRRSSRSQAVEHPRGCAASRMFWILALPVQR